jgi:hypothetical protein
MTDEKADRASGANVQLLAGLLTSLTGELHELLDELRHSLNSGGTGVDREPVAVMRDFDRAVSWWHDFGVLAGANKEPDWDARVRAIATENGGLCEITFYAGDDMPDLRRRASRAAQWADVHLRAILLTTIGFRTFEPTQPPLRCVVCSKGTAEARRLKWIMMLEDSAHPELTVAGGICGHCVRKYRSEAALRNAVVDAFRGRLQVDLRVLESPAALSGRLH